ncbi:hypothetical protein D3C71_846540 [compost metagenome]
MAQPRHVMQLGSGLQALADAAAIVGVEREQMQVQGRVLAHVLQQRHRQQSGGMSAETVGQEAHAKWTSFAQLHRGQWPHRRRHSGRARARTGQLFGRAGVFAEEREGFDHALARCKRAAHLGGQRIHVLPIAQATLPGEALCGDIRFIGHQCMCAAIGRRCAFCIVGIFQRVPQPQRDARVLRCQRRGLAQQLGGIGMRSCHPRYPAQPGKCFRMIGPQLQRASRGLLAGRNVAGLQFQVGQHHPGDEVAGLACDRLLQLLPLLPGRHAGQPAESWARASTWCSWLNRCSSGSRSPANTLGRSYRVSPSTRWSVIRPCGKL